MKYLLSLLLLIMIGCKAPNDDTKNKDAAAPFLIGTADYYRQLALDSDVIAANANASAIAAAKALPLLDLSTSSNTPAELQALNLGGVITSVDMSKGTPIVTFYVTTDKNRLKGFGWTTKTDGSYNSTTGVSNATASTYITNLTAVSNIQFTFAKLVAGTNGSPDKWVSYLTTSMPTPDGINGTGTTTVARTAGWAKNSTDQNGTIKDNGDGSYTYTFGRDITKSKDLISSEYLSTSISATLTAVSASRIAGTGDLKYDSTLPHRVAVAVGVGTVRGTGTNNTDGTNQPMMSGGCTSKTSCSGTAVTALNFTSGKTLIYD
ncbi:MAG TPA: hypothetical protein PL163_20400, partial [Leptospiraceae bacterium]|nr:hypothetical protein [Leptospiraceae bacterium]